MTLLLNKHMGLRLVKGQILPFVRISMTSAFQQLPVTNAKCEQVARFSIACRTVGVMQSVFDFTNKTQGRDKLYRTAQYVSKLLGWGMQELEADPEIIQKLAKLESHASTTRKFFRLGKSLESLQAARKTMALVDPVLRTTLTISHLNKAGFLFIDHYLWLGRIGIAKVDKRWDYISARFYLGSILLSILRDLYAVYIALKRLEQREQYNEKKVYLSLWVQCLKENPEATLDLIRNICDFPIPGSKLGYFPKHNGLVGICGLVSSLIGAYQVAYPQIKLKP